jgi:hypothetical protein
MSSSSSYDEQSGYSQLVINKLVRSSTVVTASILVDLCLPDREYVAHGINLTFATCGIFSGVSVTGPIARLVDGAVAVGRFARQPTFEQDESIAAQWADTMIGRVRAALLQLREEGPYVYDLPADQLRVI